MKTTLKSTAAILVSFSVVLFSFSGCAGRNVQRPDQNNTGQGRNIIGENMQGTDPNAGPQGGNMFGGNRDAGSGNNPPDNTGIGTTPQGIQPGTPPGAEPLDRQITDGRLKSDNIKRQLSAIPGCRNPNVIVIGNTALVGYAASGTVKDTGALRSKVTDTVRQADRTITNVVVSDSAEVVRNINQLSSDIAGNKPVNDIGNRFNQLIRSINPVGR